MTEFGELVKQAHIRLGLEPPMYDTDDTDLALRRCQAYSAALTRYVLTLIDMIDAGNPPPSHAALRAVLEGSVIRSEAKARTVK